MNVFLDLSKIMNVIVGNTKGLDIKALFVIDVELKLQKKELEEKG